MYSGTCNDFNNNNNTHTHTLLRYAKGEAPRAVPAERQGGVDYGQPSGLRPSQVPVGDCVYGRPVFAPSGATDRPAAPAVSDASVPFGAGVFDGTPVNIHRGEGLDLSSLLDEAAVSPRDDDFAALDARDTLAEDAVRTPSPDGRRSTGGSDFGPTIFPEGAAEYADESMSDGGGPWSIVRGRKRTTHDRSPLKTPLRPAHGRAKVGETPAAIKALPNAPDNQRAPAGIDLPIGTPGNATGA